MIVTRRKPKKKSGGRPWREKLGGQGREKVGLAEAAKISGVDEKRYHRE